jgi:hypothetical protein
MPLPFSRRASQTAPSFSRDFAGLKTLDHGVGPAITFTRASDATFFDASGTLQTASNNAPRFDHSGGSSLGLLIEEARTNSIRNSQAGGAATGVSGTMPTNWSAATAPNGLTREIVGTGTINGLSYIDIRYNGTTTATTGFGIFFDGPAASAAVAGQTWTSSVYVALVGGTVSGTNNIYVYAQETNGSTNVQQSVSNFRASLTSSLQRFSVTRTFTEATATHSRGSIAMDYTSGATIDITLRIAAPQLEQGAFPTSYIPTTTAAATRSADSAVVTPISSFYNQSEGTLFAEAIASTTNGMASGGNSQHAAALVENAVTNLALSLYRQNSATNGRFFVGTSGGSQADISQAGFTAGASTRLIGAYKQDDFALSVNGASASPDTSGSLPSPTSLRVGAYTATGGFLNGHIRKIAYYPRRLSNTLLQQLTT